MSAGRGVVPPLAEYRQPVKFERRRRRLDVAALSALAMVVFSIGFLTGVFAAVTP